MKYFLTIYVIFVPSDIKRISLQLQNLKTQIKMSSSSNIFATFEKQINQINKHYYRNVSPAPSPRVRRSPRLAKKAELAYKKQVQEQTEQQRLNYLALKREIHYLKGRLEEKKRDLRMMEKAFEEKKTQEEVFTPRRSARLAAKKANDYNMFM